MKIRPILKFLCLAAGISFAASPLAAQQPPRVEIMRILHAQTPPLKSFVPLLHATPNAPFRVFPVRSPKAGKGKPGGGGGGTSWTDQDIQASYGPSGLAMGVPFAGVGANGYVPPDTNLSVGPTQIVQTVNVEYAIWTKPAFGQSGGSPAFGPFALHSIFTPLGSQSQCSSIDGGDPVVLYDKLDNRWIISQLAYNSNLSQNDWCVAISSGSDAETSTYDAYDISFGSNLPDYPKIGIWNDGSGPEIFFSANMFANGNSFTGAMACEFQVPAVGSKTISYACTPGNDVNVYSILPADVEGNLTPSGIREYFLQFVTNLSSTSGDQLELYQFTQADFTKQTAVLSPVTTLTVKTFYEACGGGACVPQGGTKQKLDSLGDRLMYRLSYRDYSSGLQQLVVNHAVQVGSSSNQTGIRWYRICNQSGAVFTNSLSICQESTFDPTSSLYRWMGSIAQDQYGDIGLGYSTSNSSKEPAVAFTGMANGETGMESENILYQGLSYQTRVNRWGDYSSMSLDPSDDCTFWYTNEYLSGSSSVFNYNWQTIIGSFRFNSCK